MHFLVHNSFLFTAGVMGLVHMSLLVLVWIADVPPLVQFNILSVVVYVFCFLLCKSERIMPVYVSIILEVTVYTIVSTYYIGYRCGTYCFLFAIVPIILYFGSFLLKGAKRWIIVLILVLNFSVFAFLHIRYSEVTPIFEVSHVMRIVLFLFSTFVMVFSMIFYNMVYIYSSEVEVTSLEQENKQLSIDAQEDALTNLLNRRGFLPVIEPIMNDHQAKHFCIAFCDIDNFKRINDTYGHDAGDEVLRHIAGMIRKAMTGCAVCRWGGEEIVILMRDYDLAVAKEKMEYVRKLIESTPTVFFNKRIFATITIGLEENKDIYQEPDDIIKIADERMYYGKQHGKNILIFKDMG